ncbi:unnamed protein product, partial [Prunus brigantina]
PIFRTLRLTESLKQQWPLSASFGFFCSLCFLSCFWFHVSMAQNATTDPSEVTALISIFKQWDMQALLISGGEQCIGFSINGSEFEKPKNNPAVTCDCTYDKNTTCHMTKLRVHALNKRGVFPKEFEALRYLAVLYDVFPTPFSYKRHRKLDLNYFTGPLPAFIGNMSALTVLSFGSNNFSETLPPELGNLVNLGLFYMDSCGLGGEVPSTFAKLINMKILYASDNPFSGKIPAFIGNWRKLTSLDLGFNNLTGELPSSLFNMSSLTYL